MPESVQAQAAASGVGVAAQSDWWLGFDGVYVAVALLQSTAAAVAVGTGTVVLGNNTATVQLVQVQDHVQPRHDVSETRWSLDWQKLERERDDDDIFRIEKQKTV